MAKDKKKQEEIIREINDRGEEFSYSQTEDNFYPKYHDNAIKRLKRDRDFNLNITCPKWDNPLYNYFPDPKKRSAIYNNLRLTPFFLMDTPYNIDLEYSHNQVFFIELFEEMVRAARYNYRSNTIPEFAENYCCLKDAYKINKRNSSLKKMLEECAFDDISNELENIKKNATLLSNKTGVPYNDFFNPIVAGRYEVYHFFSHYDLEKIINSLFYNT